MPARRSAAVAEVLPLVHRSITVPMPARMDPQVPPLAPAKRSTAEGQRVMGEPRCPVRYKVGDLILHRRSIMVLIPARKEQVVPSKETEAPPPAEQPSSAALLMHRPPQEDQCRPTADDLATW
jgi:hypothetical protein